MAKGSAESPTLPLPPPRLSVEDFTEAVFKGVLRAIETQKVGTGTGRAKAGLKFGPIIYGIIYIPEGGDIQIPSVGGQVNS